MIAPEIPTMAESGLAGYDTGAWNAIVAPATEASSGLPVWSILVFPALFTAGMTLVDTRRAQELYDEMGPARETSGSTNTIALALVAVNPAFDVSTRRRVENGSASTT